MFLFILDKYRGLIVAELVLLAVVQTAAIIAYVADQWSSIGDGLVNILIFTVYAAIPFFLAFDATRRHGESIPGPSSRGGLYLGITVNLLAGLVSVVFGFLQAGASHYLVNEPEAITDFYLLAIPIGLATFLFLGAVMGWGGQGVARIVTRRRV